MSRPLNEKEAVNFAKWVKGLPNLRDPEATFLFACEQDGIDAETGKPLPLMPEEHDDRDEYWDGDE